MGWRDPGFIHSSFLKDLWPNARSFACFFLFLSVESIVSQCICLYRYNYKLGHRLNNGSYIWSKVYGFKAPPYPGQVSKQTVIISGDIGKVNEIECRDL